MYFVELSDGQIITGGTTNWQELCKMIAENGSSINQLGLTDMFHIRESISGADAYYYFADAEVVISNRMIEGQVRSVPMPPKVIGEEIAGFYSVESTRRIYEQNIQECDSSIVAIESRLKELRNTTISTDDIQRVVNTEISQQQAIADQLKLKRKRLLEERASLIAAGGFIVTRRIQIHGAKYPVNVLPDTGERILSGRIQQQDSQYWIGAVKPNFNGTNGG